MYQVGHLNAIDRLIAILLAWQSIGHMRVNAENKLLHPVGTSNSNLRAEANSLYKCELSYLQVDTSLIQFSINHLITSDELSDFKAIVVETDEFQLDEIANNATFEELRKNSKLNPKLPFIVFINGFNTFNECGEINGTWMFDVARNLASNGRAKLPPAGEEVPKALLFRLLDRLWSPSIQGERAGTNQRANVIFLTWGIPHLLSSNLFTMVPAYYKTVANYDNILEFVSSALRKLFHFVEKVHFLETGKWRNETERALYYGQFEFYGHSLGSHILTDALQRVRLALGLDQTRVKFGKMTGLDPASPCFLSHEHGISVSKLANVVEELVVVHSNAGLAGITSERAEIEIVLNGGTFQPGCSWYDFVCHHARSTDILRYRDDECQMVAYKCSSYHHFKNGACETCDEIDSRNQVLAPAMNRSSSNCVLVNLPEQHVDSAELLEFVEHSQQGRQLADDADDFGHYNGSNRLLESMDILVLKNRQQQHQERLNASMRAKKTYYYYVNTNPNFRSVRKSHCLQHYQLRMIIFNEDEHMHKIQANRCRLSKFYTSRDPTDNIKLSLIFELDPTVRAGGRVRQETLHKFTGAIGQRNIADAKIESQKIAIDDTFQLGAIIRDLLHSALVTFEGGPRLFVGAQLENVRLDELAACYRHTNATSGPSFVLDIVFMSHTSERVRQAFSSLLCGRLILDTTATTTTDDVIQPLELTLCKRAQLQNVSARIDQLFEQIKLQRLDDTWRESLLNNLFSLFIQWEPF